MLKLEQGRGTMQNEIPTEVRHAMMELLDGLLTIKFKTKRPNMPWMEFPNFEAFYEEKKDRFNFSIINENKLYCSILCTYAYFQLRRMNWSFDNLTNALHQIILNNIDHYKKLLDSNWTPIVSDIKAKQEKHLNAILIDKAN